LRLSTVLHPANELHMVGVTTCLSTSPQGSRPGGALERSEVRGSTLEITSQNPHPTLSLGKGETNIALTT
jgi:hypothetical protein